MGIFSFFILSGTFLSTSNPSGRKNWIRFPHQRVWRRVEFEGFGWGYRLRGYPECTTLPHLCHHAKRFDSQTRPRHGYFPTPSRCLFSIGVYDQALDDPNLQILPDRSHLVWIHILHVWMARPREGHFIGPCTTEVSYSGSLCIMSD